MLISLSCRRTLSLGVRCHNNRCFSPSSMAWGTTFIRMEGRRSSSLASLGNARTVSTTPRVVGRPTRSSLRRDGGGGDSGGGITACRRSMVPLKEAMGPSTLWFRTTARYSSVAGGMPWVGRFGQHPHQYQSHPSSVVSPLLQSGASCALFSTLRTTHRERRPPSLPLRVGCLAAPFSAWPPPRGTGGRGGIISTVVASGLLLSGKAKYVLGALKLTKLASLGSLAVSVGAYSMFYGLPYAVGMVSLILVHESGHAAAMRYYGIPFSPMVFVPFLGASVAMNRNPSDAYQEAMIALAGPVAGTAGAWAVCASAHATNSDLLFALADFGFMINLFNLLPIGMMDGGRICGALSPYAGVAGLGMGGALIYADVISNPIFYLVMMGGAYTTFMRFYDPTASAPRDYYRITGWQKTKLTASYFGLLTFLLASMAANEKFKRTPQQLQWEQQRKRYVEDTYY